MKSFVERFASCVILLGAFIIAISRAPAPLILFTVILLAVLSQLEFYSMVRRIGIPVFQYLGVIAGIGLIVITYLALDPTSGENLRSYKIEHMLLASTLIAVFIRQFPQKNNKRPVETVACTLFGIWYIPYLINFIQRLVFWEGRAYKMSVSNTGSLLIIYLVMVVKGVDIGGYIAGKLLGRHKLIPRLSPAKTWEGVIGGVAFAYIIGLTFFFITSGKLGDSVKFTLIDALSLPFFLSISAILGDLFESLIKRSASVKDSGGVIPGFGGFLDILDSLIFSAPIFYTYIKLFVA